MAKLASSIRSAARATFSAPSRIPIRWRLAGGSAILTLVILCGFAGAVGALTTERIREDFRNETARAADELRKQVVVEIDPLTGGFDYQRPDLGQTARVDGAVIRIIDPYTQTVLREAPERAAPILGEPFLQTVETNGFRVVTREVQVEGTPYSVILQYGRPIADVDATVQQVRFFLVMGVLSGTALALLAGLMIARRAMAPIAALTATARDIGRTRDPTKRVPQPAAEDEVAELAGTLDDMLLALAASREETEAMLQRQREFVADASHELRTPLTSVLANLELLADTLDGEREEAARSALRSTQRMRRLVADLLLLARADVGRAAPRAPTDIGQVLVEAAAELEPVAGAHELEVEAERALVDGSRDELHRLALNLMENALRHTPEGTHVRACVGARNGHVTLTVEDDGPGIPPGVREKVFERFVRGAGDRGGSFGLGLSIVRAVAQAHGGQVQLASPSVDAHGTRFTVTLPALHEPATLVDSR